MDLSAWHVLTEQLINHREELGVEKIETLSLTSSVDFRFNVSIFLLIMSKSNTDPSGILRDFSEWEGLLGKGQFPFEAQEKIKLTYFWNQ